jgi:hypothetical protein
VPVEQRLELVTAIGSDGSYPKRELLHDVVDEVDGVGLRVASVDLECANSRGVVDGCVLVTSHRRTLFPLQRQELHVDLHVVAGDLLLVAMRMDGTPSDTVRKSVDAMPLADPIDGRVGRPDTVVAMQVPDDTNRPHVVGSAQVQDLFHHHIGRFVRVVVGATSAASESLLTELAIPIPPQVEGRSRNPKVSAGLVDVPDALGVLKDSLLSMNLSLVVRPSDLLGHHLL